LCGGVIGEEMAGLLAPGPTLAQAEELRRQKGSRGLLEAVGGPMSYAPNPVVAALGQGLLGARYLTGEKDFGDGMASLSDMTALAVGSRIPSPIMQAGRAARKVFEVPDAKALESSTLPPLDLKIAKSFDEFRAAASRYGEAVDYGTWAFTDPAGKTTILHPDVMKKMRGPNDVQRVVVHEQAVRKATQLLDTDDGYKMGEAVLDAARRGDAEAVSKDTIDLVRKIDAGRFGNFNEASTLAEVLAAELRNQELAVMRLRK
jgi:hypothetical protein